MPAPLPPNDYQNQLQWREAYDKCLHYEHNAAGVNDALVRARVLGYSMREAPDDDGRSSIAREINSCNDDNAFEDLATMYINYFVCYFRAAKGCTPTPSTPSSIDDTPDTSKYLLEKAPLNHTTAKRKALIRDGYRCMLTGAYDIHSIRAMPHIRPPGVFDVGPTQAAHIFPEPTTAGISGTEGNSRKLDYAASGWTFMTRFGHSHISDELNGAKIHRLENVMTLCPNIHVLFDSLELWLESTDIPHTYRPNSVEPLVRSRIPPTVTFMTPDPTNLPRPSPVYLRLHATAARVAHLSGAGEYAKKVLRDMEETRVLSGDGTSADLLVAALGAISVH